MTAIVSVMSGGSVVHTQRLERLSNGKAARIGAITGARYVLAEMWGETGLHNIAVKRVGKSLVIEQSSGDAEPETLIVEDFFGADAQLVGIGADGEYLQYLSATEAGVADVAQLSDGASAWLSSAADQSPTVAGGLPFADSGAPAPGGALGALATVAGGVALNNGNSSTGKATPAPSASVFMMDAQAAGAEVHELLPMTGEGGYATVAQEVGGEAAPVATAAEAQSTPRAALARDDTPVIEKVVDDYGLIQGVIENGGYTDDGYLTIMGKAEPGVKVHLYRNNYLLNYVFADANGEWSYTPTTPFTTGKHSITIVHEYADKETSAQSAPYVITVDKIPPAIPVITGIVDDEGRITGAIADQAVTDDNRPTINGKAEAHAKVIVYDKGKEIGSTTVGADGKWSFTPETPLVDGLHMLGYSAMDRAGNSSQLTTVSEFIVDTRPEKINIYYADDDVGSVTGGFFSGSITDDSTPTLHGVATAGGIVKIYEGAVLLGQVTADVDGSWEFTPTIPLSEGAHTLHATVTLVAKGESERSKPFALTVDSQPLDRPTIVAVVDDVGAITTNVTQGGVTDDSKPEFKGKAQALSTVVIWNNGVEIGRVQADASGNWAYTPGSALGDGTHSVVVNAVNSAGTVSAPSDAFGFTVDTLPPAKPTIVTVADDVGSITTNVILGGVTDDAKPEFKGKAEANSTVIIKDGSLEIGRVQADASGNWTFTPVNALSDGAHGISVIAVDMAGNTSVPSELFGFMVDTLPPAKPTIVTVADDVGSITTNVTLGGITDDTRPEFKGKAEANSTVIIKDGSAEIGRVQADADGNWTFTPGIELSNGKHDISVTAVDLAGNVSVPSEVFGFTVDALPSIKPTIVAVVDDVGAITTNVSQGGVTDDTKPEFKGKAGANSTVIIKDGNVEVGRVQSDANGNWTFTPGNALAEGAHSMTVIAVNLAGNVSAPSDAFGFTIDTVPPDKPTIVTVADDVGSITGNVLAGGTTDDTRPEFKGKAEANATVVIKDGNAEIGRVQADANGNWTFTPGNVLSNGTHNITVTAIDQAGNASVPSEAFGFTVDALPPAKPTIMAVYDDVGHAPVAMTQGIVTDDNKPYIVGKAEPFSTVIIMDNGGEIGREQLGSGGTLYFTPEKALDDGAHRITLVAVDVAGNVSAPSDAFSFTVDATPPPKPTIVTVADDVGSITTNVPQGGVTDDTKPEFKGKAEANSIVIIKDGSLELGRVSADVNGNWTFTPGNALGNGVHSISVIAVDLAGNASVPSDVFSFTVDTLPPAKPTIVTVTDDVGAVQGTVSNGGRTDDNKPTLAGKAEAGATVKVYDGNTLLGSVLADSKGDWRFTPSTALADGSHTFTAEAQDLAGNSSGKGTAITVIVDTSITVYKPLAVDLNGGAEGGLKQSYMIKTGTAPTQTYRIYVDGKLQETVTLGSSVNWNSAIWWTNATTQVFTLFVVKDGYEIEVARHTGTQLMSETSGPEGHIMLNNAVVVFSPATRGVPSTLAVDGDVVSTGDVVAVEGSLSNTVPGSRSLPLGGAKDRDGEPAMDDSRVYPGHAHAEGDDEIVTKPGVADGVSGDAGDDIVSDVGTGHAGSGDDIAGGISGELAQESGGLGIDTLVMDGHAPHADLPAIAPKVQGFDGFDLDPAGNVLSLRIADLLVNGAQNMLLADGNVLMLDSEAAGELNCLRGLEDWMGADSTMVSGVSYEVYANHVGSVDLLVEDVLRVTIP